MKVLIRSKNRPDSLRKTIESVIENHPGYLSIHVVNSTDAPGVKVPALNYPRLQHEVVPGTTTLYGSTIKLFSGLKDGDKAFFIDDDEILKPGITGQVADMLEHVPFVSNGRGYEYISYMYDNLVRSHFGDFSFFAFKWSARAILEILPTLRRIDVAQRAMGLNLSQEDTIGSLLLSFREENGGVIMQCTDSSERGPRFYDPGYEQIDNILAAENLYPACALAFCWESPFKFYRRRALVAAKVGSEAACARVY